MHDARFAVPFAVQEQCLQLGHRVIQQGAGLAWSIKIHGLPSNFNGVPKLTEVFPSSTRRWKASASQRGRCTMGTAHKYEQPNHIQIIYTNEFYEYCS